ncbi:multicopper oxidase [Streptomyces canarius]
MAALTAWTSVHLHGGRQHAISDGVPDSGATCGSAQLAEYTNDMAAAHLFYHDHAMPVTALNVMAGLFGNYIVRDEEEDRLHLPCGRYEIPLAITDVNFDTDAQGRIDGRLLAKRVQTEPTVPGVMTSALHFQGPYTMVNGRVWPYLDVEATAYRFRVVNASNARPYTLALVDEKTGKSLKGAILVIGTDLGLLDKPVVIDDTFTLTSGERADIVIDFAAFRGRRLKLVNVAPGTADAPPAPADPRARGRCAVPAGHAVPRGPRPAPRLRRAEEAGPPVQASERVRHSEERGRALRPALARPDGDADGHGIKEAPAGTKTGKGVVQIALPGKTRTFRVLGRHFEDPANFYAAVGSWEKWTFISVGPVTQHIQHPMHIHLMNFQVLARHTVDGTAFDTALGGTTRPITVKDSVPIATSESGWKDTVNLMANSMVTIAGQFGTETGRFMYHCHILDHEDEGMMRPLVVMPPQVLTLQNMMRKMMNAPGKPDSRDGGMPPMDHGTMG